MSNPFAKLLARLSKSKLSSARSSQSFDTRHITDTIDQALASAGLRNTNGTQDIRATITDALTQAGLGHTAPIYGESAVSSPVVERRQPAGAPPLAAGGALVDRSIRNAAGTRTYKLYVPTNYESNTEARVPLIVMLHGCTQSPDDFAVGTRMNALADIHGFLVAYPAQTPKDNGSKCWNWFRSQDQVRAQGEPSLIADIAQTVASEYRVDTRRIFVAGLSAGAAMAVILGETYPDLFAGIGVHSGLPYGAAHDVPSAFGAMKNGVDSVSPRTRVANARVVKTVPTIVFHGDADRTVAHRNGLAIVSNAIEADMGGQPLKKTTVKGAVDGGRSFVREVFTNADARALVEFWTVQGAGHAWSGGSASGSYTDPVGPNASAEMVRFFMEQPVDAVESHAFK